MLEVPTSSDKTQSCASLKPEVYRPFFIVQFIGGTPADALRFTMEMYNITVAEDKRYQLPPLGFRGSPIGIDIRQVVRQHLLPIINTGIAHRLPGIGQIGAGVVRPPMECFVAAIHELAASVKEQS
jgi:hypothetical protein